MTKCVAYVGNSILVKLSELKAEGEVDFINDATVTLTLLDPDGEEVAGQTWPTTMDSVGTDSEGEYQAVIEHDAELTADLEYTAVIDVNAGSNRRAHFEFVVKAKTRRGA